MKSIQVLLSEGHADLRNTMCSILEMDGFKVTAGEKFDDIADILLHRLPGHPPVNILIVDVGLGSFGLRLVELARKATPEPLVMALTGFGTKDSVLGLMRRGVSEYLEKPFHMNEFRARAARLRDQVLGTHFPGMAWGSPDAEAAYRDFHEGCKEGLKGGDAPGFSGTLPADCSLTGRFKRLESSAEEREIAAIHATPTGCDILIAEVEGRDSESFYQLMLIKAFFEHHRRHPTDPASCLRFLNRMLEEDALEQRKVKALSARYFRKEGRVEISNSGGLPVFHLPKGSHACRSMDVPGSPLGLDGEFHIHSGIMKVRPGDRLFFATEGLCAASRPQPETGNRDRLGQEGLEALILAHRHQDLQDSVDAVWRDALAFLEPHSEAGVFVWGLEIP